MGANKRDPIPEHFDSPEVAGEFWDTHSAADYWDEMEEAEMEFDIQKRTFWVPIGGQMYDRESKSALDKNNARWNRSSAICWLNNWLKKFTSVFGDLICLQGNSPGDE